MLRTPHLIAALVLALPTAARAEGEPTEAPAANASAADTAQAAAPTVRVVGSVRDAATKEGLPASYIQIHGADGDAYQRPVSATAGQFDDWPSPVSGN